VAQHLWVFPALTMGGQERDEARLLLWRMDGVGKKPRKFWVDSGYWGALVHSVTHRLRFCLQVVTPQRKPHGSALPARCWVGERAFAWLGNHRRLSKDYDYLTESSKAFLDIPATRLILCRLARA